jgi:hypothetical protein
MAEALMQDQLQRFSLANKPWEEFERNAEPVSTSRKLIETCKKIRRENHDKNHHGQAH